MPPDTVGRETAGDDARRRSVQSPASSSTSLSTRSESASAGPHRGLSSSDDDVVTASSGREDTLSTTQAKTKTPSPRPSILSRFNLPLPLRSRNRNLVDFHVRCDEPHKNYSPGDSVRGSVVLVVIKPVRITHLVVTLHGYVRVLRDPTSVAKAQSVTVVPPAGSSKRPRYQGNGLASLFQDEQVLSGEGRIEPGKYEFGFDLMFPDKRLPSSIDVSTVCPARRCFLLLLLLLLTSFPV